MMGRYLKQSDIGPGLVRSGLWVILKSTEKDNANESK